MNQPLPISPNDHMQQVANYYREGKFSANAVAMIYSFYIHDLATLEKALGNLGIDWKLLGLNKEA